jgi:hypothetical protein
MGQNATVSVARGDTDPRAGGPFSFRVVLPDGAATTAHVRVHEESGTDTRLVVLRRPEPLAA